MSAIVLSRDKCKFISYIYDRVAVFCLNKRKVRKLFYKIISFYFEIIFK